jgi:hypothetical protein
MRFRRCPKDLQILTGKVKRIGLIRSEGHSLAYPTFRPATFWERMCYRFYINPRAPVWREVKASPKR